MTIPFMAELGYFAVVLAFAACVYAIVASVVGTRLHIGELVASGRRALLAVGALTSLSVLVLVVSFLVHDFTLKYVWQTSSRTTPLFYLVTGLWGGQAGSLLFWSWLLTMYASVAVLRPWRADSALLPYFTAVCAGVAGFFLFLVGFVANPFERLAVVPMDGNGLNPLLQHPGMAFHPPMLYLGFTGMTIPFAFGMAALLARRTDAGWIHASRRWLLVGWVFLSIGLSLGARWAYDVLGWGGYWGWDPVENAAFMPWLAATAFLHSVMIQERRGTFKVWNMVLIILAFSLTIIGTFLTRAGLVSSVHSFAQSNIGPYFLVFTAAVVLGSLVLVWLRLPDLSSDGQVEHALSREGGFMLNNVFFMGALFAVFTGTLFPLVSEIVTNQRVTVGPPYFNTVVMPIFGLLILLMAIGPLLPWRQADAGQLGRALWRPFVASLAITAGLWALGVRHWIAVVGFGTCTFALIVTLLEFLRGLRQRTARGDGPFTALLTLFGRNRRRYGGYLVHIGIILLGIGVIGSNVYQQQLEQTLAIGQSMSIGSYTLRYTGPGTQSDPDHETLFANLEVADANGVLADLQPRRDVFRTRIDQPVTIPAILHRPLEDVYALLGMFDRDTQRATVKVFVNPLISWVWIGMLTLVLGTMVAAWPDRAEERVLNTELKRLLGGVASPARAE